MLEVVNSKCLKKQFKLQRALQTFKLNLNIIEDSLG
uniref:Uncharacterized protein n=1 Tax=Manihot esculenta TaxID=3983 RepID=A0A2C9W423_MANES